MVGIIALLRKREQTKSEFLVADRSASWVLTAFSMAATWVWAPSMFTAAEKAYTQGFAGVFWFVVPNVLTLVLFAFFAKKMRNLRPNGWTFSDYIREKYSKRAHNMFLIESFGLQIPMTYIYLYKVGVALNKLRISQFFSIDTIKTLPKVLEFYPDLYERVIRREPNADLVMLYWDTDMFRSTKQDQKFDLDKDKDYRIVLKEEMKKASQHPDMYPGYKEAKKLYARVDERTSSATCKRLYQMLVAGDPKKRTYRVILGDIMKENQQLEERRGNK